jgi:hypothetical protein
MNKWEVRENNVALICFGLSMVYALCLMFSGTAGFGVLSGIHAIIFIFGYNPVKEKP